MAEAAEAKASVAVEMVDQAGTEPAPPGPDKAGTDAEGPKKEEDTMPPLRYRQLFRYATCTDHVVLGLGVVCSMALGLALPAFSVLFGDLLDTLNDPEDFQDEVDDIALTFVVIGIIAFVASIGELSLMNISAARQVKMARQQYFRSLLRQDIGWFDTNSAGDMSTRLAENTIALQNGMGGKLGNLVHNASTFISGLVVGFVFSWRMTLVICAFLPFMGMSVHMMTVFSSKYEKEMKTSYADAGAVAEESLTNFLTVCAHNTQDVEVAKYKSHLKAAETAGVRKAAYIGLSMGSMYFFMMALYGVGLWYGGQLVIESHEDNINCIGDPSVRDCFTGGDVMLVFFSVVMSAFSVGQIAPAFSAMTAARAAGARVFAIIDRTPKIDSLSTEGTRLPTLRGEISFNNVRFTYPSRPNQVILKDFSLEVKPGETVAFVGESGSGKSTIIALLQRFYDLDAGSIEIDGVPLAELNLTDFRKHIGLVSQEPTLFDNTIEENIMFGVPEGVPFSRDDVVRAAKMANAHEFIESLENGYDTRVGERGAQLSGGQKQRVAIARAIARNPSILLLDEATSALDSRSEKVVQRALDSLLQSSESGSRTTFVIAHRLSTVLGADRVVVLDHGSVVEVGSPSDLAANPSGYFARMLAMQQLSEANQDADDEPDTPMPTDDKVAEGVDVVVDGSDDAADGDANKAGSGTSGDASDAGGKDKKGKKEKNEDLADVRFMDVWRFQRGTYCILAGGMMAAAVNGSIMPLFSIVFTEILNVLFVARPDANNPDLEATTDKLEEDTLVMMLYFFLLAVASGVCYFLQPYLFSVAGERLTTRLRGEAFQSLMKQEPAFFDDSKHNVGVMTTRLSTDAALIQHTTGQKLGLTIQNNVALLTALVIAFASSWRLSLVVLGTMPFMMMAGLAMMKFVMGADKDTTFTAAGALASEAVAGIRTVTALGMQKRVEQEFMKRLEEGNRQARVQHWWGGIFFGLSQFVIFGSYAVCFWAGSRFIDEGYIEFDDMLRVFFALSMASWSVGENAQHAADQGLADKAKRSVFALIWRKSKLDPTVDEGEKPSACRGAVEFRDVNFRYPTRPKHQVLKGVSFTAQPGSVVAFVGASGCGKSTIIRLLQRLYTPESGSILLDGAPIDQLNLKWLRGQLGLVQQEPSLFGDTLLYNIAYARDDLRPEPTPPRAPQGAALTDDDVSGEVVSAARDANALTFIHTFPSGYATKAGPGGNQLSGGQKQRIAIARAIISSPRLLLLDEATSALDSESEAVVQAALDKLMRSERGGRTTLVIAHRLSTIMHADMIVVMHNGEVVEVGDHATLLQNQGGRYAKLVRAQGGGTAAAGVAAGGAAAEDA